MKPDEESQPRALSGLGRNLTDLAKEGFLPPLHPRDALLTRLQQILASGDHVILVGPSGAGKTALVEHLAQAIAEASSRLPAELKGRPVLEYAVAFFQIGCVHVNEFETRIANIVHKCRDERAILVLDRMEEAVHAGACDGKEDRTLANLLIPFLHSRRLSVVGTTTPEGYRFMIGRNPAFVERFRTIEVPSMTVEETAALQDSLAVRVQRRYGAVLDPSGFAEAIDLAERFYPWRAFPGEAFDLIREAAALLCQSRPLTVRATAPGRITAQEVRDVLVRRCGLPGWVVDPSVPVKAAVLRQLIEKDVFGQPSAVQAVVDALLTFKVGLNDRSRPIAAFLLLGPTGVGKTQLAKTVARLLFGSEDRLLRYDMAEYASWQAVYSLTSGREAIGRPGLVSEIQSQPFRVILFDEIEKAHPHVEALLLALLGEGRLTDDNGRTASFANTLILMTSNVGADLYGKPVVGFGMHQEVPPVTETELKERVATRFLPEFVNRLSGMLIFRPLNSETIRRIAEREVREIAARPGLSRYRVALEPDDGALEVLVGLGFDSRYGARQMKRAVEETVVRPLAEKLSSGEIMPGQRIRLTGGQGHLRFRCDPTRYWQEALL